jgi:hypothetical protein
MQANLLDKTLWNFGGVPNGKTVIQFFGENPGSIVIDKEVGEAFIKDLSFYLNSGCLSKETPAPIQTPSA